ncbi:MAG TPA: HAMP domain-containing sensor histidine kinase [Flavipsychrobacter sp.]|nr:HAMP domain-containing sensor histidine kinase [Flavipsychrobacter sp.]
MQIKENIRDDRITNNLIADLIHELRNPLANINLAVDMLEDYVTPPALPYIDIIKRNAIRIKDLLSGIINYHNFLKGDKTPTSLYQILNEVVELVTDRLTLRKIHINKLKQTGCIMLCNRGRMKIALTNILINSIEAMTEQEGFLYIHTAMTDGKYVLTISDNGCGMNSDQLKSIYTPYFSNKIGGLGLGMAISKRILEENEITVEVESQVGMGTRFILTIDPCQILASPNPLPAPWITTFHRVPAAIQMPAVPFEINGMSLNHTVNEALL